MFPLDADEKVIGDDTDFVDTWEVSESQMAVAQNGKSQ